MAKQYTGTEPEVVREEYDREPLTVTGELKQKYIPLLDYTRSEIDGVLVDTATVKPAEDGDKDFSDITDALRRLYK